MPLEAKEAVQNLLSPENRWIGQGPKVDEFEEAFEKKFGVKNAVAVNSGTSSLELAYDLLGIGPGDEVIAPVLTCTATTLPIVRRGAKLVFADIKKDTLTIDPEDVRRKITQNTKAIVVVDLHGIEASRGPFYKYVGEDSFEFRIPVVVDAAQALGNTGGDFTCYSFQAIKHVTTGDGGMLVCRWDEQYKEAKLRRWFGIDRALKIKNNWQPYKQRAILFDITYPGYKFQMNDIAATLGLIGLNHYDEVMALRKKVFDIYKESGITMVDGYHNKYGYACILSEDRNRLTAYLENKGIETNVMQVRNDAYSVFKDSKTDLPNMDWVDSRYVCLPMHNAMTLTEARYIRDCIIQYGKENK